MPCFKTVHFLITKQDLGLYELRAFVTFMQFFEKKRISRLYTGLFPNIECLFHIALCQFDVHTEKHVSVKNMYWSSFKGKERKMFDFL